MKSHSVQKGKSPEKERVRVMLKCKLQNLSSKSVINSVHDLNMTFMVWSPCKFRYMDQIRF